MDKKFNSIDIELPKICKCCRKTRQQESSITKLR